MKNEKILIWEDQDRERSVFEGVINAARLLRELITVFNNIVRKIPTVKALGVTPAELERLIADPQGLFNDRLLAIEVPAGLKRAAYLNMVELPDFAPVNEAWQRFRATGFPDPELYNLENEEISMNKAEVQKLAESQNLYVTKNSPEYNLSQELQEFIRLLNHFDVMTENGFLDRLYYAGCPIDSLLDIVEKPGSYTRKIAKFNPHKFQRFIQRKFATAPEV